ncbi:MAG: hypothetical protein QOD39_3908 [Mycobacterium sp.]|nr:hypothetical protein [Mycobacterium sp.]
MLNRILIGVMGVAGAAAIGAPGIAAADPPPPPNVNAFPSAKPSEYAVMDGAWYAFGVLDGVTCVLDKQSGAYGCSGPIPAAPGGANLVTGGPMGKPGFASSAQPLYGVVENAKALPPNTRLSFRTVSCGTDGFVTTCLNAADQSGFVLSPEGSFTFG